MRASRIYFIVVLMAALVSILYCSHLYVLFTQTRDNAQETKRKLMHELTVPSRSKTMSGEAEGKRILVTGGAGFLGSHLVDRLMKEGHKVIVVDNFFTGQRDNLAQWLQHPRFQLIEHDIIEPLDVEVDEIYHLACPASPPVFLAHPVFTINTNTLGTHNMLELAKRKGAKLLLASTSEVYGDPQVATQPEEYRGYVNPVGSRSAYDEGKRAAEAMVYSYNKEHNVSVRIARISNSYGPRLGKDGGGVVGSFVKQAVSNKPIYIYGTGNQTRCMQYVSDTVEGLVRLMAAPYSLPINLAGSEHFTILELANIILSAVPDSKSEIVSKPPREDDPQRRRPELTKASTILNWSAKVPLKEGLPPTIAYFQEKLKKGNTATQENDAK